MKEMRKAARTEQQNEAIMRPVAPNGMHLAHCAKMDAQKQSFHTIWRRGPTGRLEGLASPFEKGPTRTFGSKELALLSRRGPCGVGGLPLFQRDSFEMKEHKGVCAMNSRAWARGHEMYSMAFTERRRG